MNIDHTQYEGLIQRIIKKYPKQYREDLQQECYLTLFEIAAKFEDVEENFIKYASKTLYYTCIDYMNKNNLNHISLDKEYEGEDGESYTLADMIQDPTDLQSHLEAVDELRVMDEDIRRIKELHLQEGYTIEEISAMYAETEPKSIRTIKRILSS